MYEVVSEISRWAIPLFILIVPVVAAARGVKVFETFVEGAEQGFALAVKLIPYLVAMLVAISVFRESGAMEVMGRVLGPGLARLGFPVEVLPHAILRPLSGGAALGVAAELMKTHGPDSFVGHLVSTMQGASDTTFYVLAVYFGSVGIRRYRYAVVSGLLADFVTLVASVVVVGKVYGTGP